MKRLKFSLGLMMATIFVIVGFQAYWLYKLYTEELNSLKRETSVLLKKSVQQLQDKTLRIDSATFDMPFEDEMMHHRMPPPIVFQQIKEGVIKKVDSVQHKTSAKATITFSPDSSKKRIIINESNVQDSHFVIRRMPPTNDPATQKKIDSLMAASKGPGIKIVVNTDSSKKELPKDVKAVFISSTPKINHPQKDTTVKLNNGGTVKATVTGKTKEKDVLKSVVLQLKTLFDSIPVKKLDSVYAINLKESKVNISYALKMYEHKDTTDNNKAILKTGFVGMGFNAPFFYRASFENPALFILKKLTIPIIISLLLIGITAISFMYLYRSLLAQQKLSEIKNEFISNITHELKTPIATVNVAIEALKNFGIIQNPEKTKEYLDISSAELQRLSLLVDKVLKLSMFENKAIELNKETFDLKLLMEEVLLTMKLQFEKQNASVEFVTGGNDFSIYADKLHITSVVFNLLDNALKYSTGKPALKISIEERQNNIAFSVTDNGIGIAAEYTTKIFDKFFRVPTNYKHNVKGYGLGLSYVHQVVQKHNGSISVQSELNKGSEFTVIIPKSKQA